MHPSRRSADVRMNLFPRTLKRARYVAQGMAR